MLLAVSVMGVHGDPDFQGVSSPLLTGLLLGSVPTLGVVVGGALLVGAGWALGRRTATSWKLAVGVCVLLLFMGCGPLGLYGLFALLRLEARVAFGVEPAGGGG